MGFGETFFGVVGEARRPTLAVAGRINVEAVSRPWLVMLFQVIRATTPVLEYAVGALNLIEHIPSQYEFKLFAYFVQKMKDERGHDGMLAADLERAGISDPWTVPANPFVAEMVGRQYYLVDFVHPAVYLGFIGLLEGFPPTIEQVEELAQKSKLPPEAWRTARLHAEADVKHRAALSDMLDATPAALHPNILANAIRCTQLQAAALESLAFQYTPPPEEWTP